MDQRARLNAALANYPQLTRLIQRVPKWEQTLLDAWNIGANAGEIHPLLHLLLGEDEEQRRSDLETGLPELNLTDHVATDFARRIVVETIAEHRDSASALTELYVGGRLGAAGANVSFVNRAAGTKTPDLTATRGGITVTLEVASGNVSDQDRDQDIADAKAFRAWARGSAPPVLKRGEASERLGGSLRFLEKSVAPLGGGDLGAMVGRIASKKSDDQLRGWPNPVLVRSFWHMFGVSRTWCCSNGGTAEAPCTGLLYAATYGYEGDPIYEGETFDGEPISYCTQRGDGILVRSQIVGAALWLFEKDLPVLFESTTVDFGERAIELLLDAFGLHRDTVSRIRSVQSPTREEVATAAYYRWRARGGDAAAERATDDWLRAERELRLTSPGGR